MSFAAKVDTGGTNPSPIGSSLYGVCETAAATPAKTVVLDDFDTLVVGTTVHIKFLNTNTAEDPTLAVGATDAKPIMRYQTVAPGITEATSWKANSVLSLTYDGVYWRINDVGAEQAIMDAASSALSAAVAASDAAIREVIAPAYNASATYELGSLVFYNGYLYRCVSEISTAEAWNSAHWSQTKVASETMPRRGTITLSATWSGSNPWYQTVTVSGTTVYANSNVSLQPDYTAFNRMVADGTAAIYIANNNGVLTAYAILKKPTAAMTVQCLVSETT